MSGTTPRPWFWNSYSAIFGGPRVMVDGEPEYTVVVPFPRPTRGDITTKEGEANARLIVEAVNNYDDLQAALVHLAMRRHEHAAGCDGCETVRRMVQLALHETPA